MISHLDLFAGIGGFSLALRNAYPGKIKTSYSEIDKYAKKIFQRHFPEAEAHGDIKFIRGKEIGYHGLVTFGFPCQDISLAGRRIGIEGGKRSSLFFEAIRIIDEIRPEYFVAENVKGFFSSHKGKDFVVALKAITDIGYDCQWQLINTKWFLPQNRERVFIVGHLREKPRPKVFPIQEDIRYSDESSEIRKAKNNTAGCITIKNNSPNWQFDSSTTLIQVGNIDTKNNNSIWGRVYDPTGIATTLNAEGGGLGAKTGLYAVDKTEIRRLTPTECERLQGYPDNFTKYGYDGKEISDTQRYKVLGNAISIPPVEEIFRRLYGVK